MKKIIIAFLVFSPLSKVIAQKNITLEDIWLKYAYSSKGVYGWSSMSDGYHYTVHKENKIIKYDYNSNSVQHEWSFKVGDQTLDFDDYRFSSDEKKIMLSTESESIYRHSTLDKNYIYEIEHDRLFELDEGGKQQYATFSPDAKRVAYLKYNNIFIKNIENSQLVQVTTDGLSNHIINGGADWVYEEEFALTRAFEWSPDGKQLMFLRFNETEVPMFEMAMYEGRLYPQDYTFKYPKVGEKNAVVSLHIYQLSSGEINEVVFDTPFEYIPRIGYSPDGKYAYAITMNRLQNQLQFWLIQHDGKPRLLFSEKSDTYIEIQDHFQFSPDGNQLLWTSEIDGYNHIYLIDVATGKQTRITKGNWEVTKVFGMDAKNKLIYYSSTEVSPLERHTYAISMDGKKKSRLTPHPGVNNTQFSSNFNYMICNRSQQGVPPIITLCDNKGKELRTLEDNKLLREKLDQTGISRPEFFTCKNRGGEVLNGYIIKPANFDASKKYPVLMYVYGGPGSQQVMDQWGGSNYMWFQMLVQQGYIVACVDNRGTGGRGKSFRDCTYKQLGKLETEDQIDAALFLGSLPYVEKSRIGIFGWSYGGYMSSLCITQGADVFKAAIAVAPVTNWKFYDSIYTERYMGTTESNPDGYDANAPIAFADKLRGNYLLIHGTADDNVHWQNSAEMIRALVKAGKQFDLFLYPDKNHGIYGGNTRHHLFTLMTEFIQKKL